MPIAKSGNLQSDDRNSFINDRGGNVARNVVAEFKDGETISSIPSGLSKDIRTTTMIVGDIPVKLPASPLVDRNFMIISNKSELETLYVGKSDVLASEDVGTTSGFEIPPHESFNIAIKSTTGVELYGVAPSGKTIKLKILEVS